MKICRRGLYVQIIDGIGTVRACGWAGYYILGNLRDQSMEEIFSNGKTKEFIRSLAEGTYDYCNEENCPYMANGTLDSMLIDIEEMPKYPTELALAYDNRCNYKCTCCVSHCNKRMDPEVQSKIENEIRKCLPYAKTVMANGLGEFFVSETIMKIVSEWNPQDIENAVFDLETNGSMFTPENWEKVKNIGNAQLNVYVTVMSFEEAAYQYLSGTALKIDNILRNLKFIKELREQGIINKLEIATVVQERNFRTLPQFVERCINEFGADVVRVRRFLPEKAMDENYEWFFDVRNPLHPYHQEFLEMMKHPIFKDPHVFNWTGDHLSNRGELPAKANYRVMRDLMLIDDVGKKISDYLIQSGYEEIVLYAITDIGRALVKVLKDQAIRIKYVYDRNTSLTQWNGYEVRKPLHDSLIITEEPLLVTLVPRHDEMVESLRHLGFEGTILSLDEILSTFR